MSRIAVIGAGVAGLTTAHLLSAAHEVWVLERDARIGGHTHTVAVPTNEGLVPVDTGFIVHNRENYPGFVRLMARLGVDTCPSDMSFAVSGGDLDWCSRGIDGLFTDRRNLVRPAFYGLLREIFRFNARGRRLLDEGEGPTPALGAWLDAERFSDRFRRHYLLPMAGAVWSTSLEDMHGFPARVLLRFFHNHGMLGATTQRPWRTIAGGTSRYLEPLAAPFRERIRTGVQVHAVRRRPDGVEVACAGEEPLRFDAVVFACHGDQVLPMLADPDPREREVLGAFRSNANRTLLHSDPALMPARRRGWAAWNVHLDQAPGGLVMSYHMNRLQPLRTSTDLFVSLNAQHRIDPARVHADLHYEHPRYTFASERARARWVEISGRDRIHFAGAYWGYGFHEDGVQSAIRVAAALGTPW